LIGKVKKPCQMAL